MVFQRTISITLVISNSALGEANRAIQHKHIRVHPLRVLALDVAR